MTNVKPYFTLCRIYISFFAACSAATGFFLAPAHRVAGVFVPAAAVFLLACGASAFNQYKKRAHDARMKRTRHRPIPSGIIPLKATLLLSLVLVLSGMF